MSGLFFVPKNLFSEEILYKLINKPKELDFYKEKVGDLNNILTGLVRKDTTKGVLGGYYFLNRKSDKAVMYVRGGTGNFGSFKPGTILLNWFSLYDFLLQGYSVIVPEFYSKDGFIKTDAGGKNDSYVIAETLKLFKDLNFELAIGVSNGIEILVNGLNEAGVKLKSVVSFSGNTNEAELLKFRDENYRLARAEFYNTGDLDEVNYRTIINSNILNKVSTKFIVIHDTEDTKVPYKHIEMFMNKLDQEGINFDKHITTSYGHELFKTPSKYSQFLNSELLNIP